MSLTRRRRARRGRAPARRVRPADLRRLAARGGGADPPVAGVDAGRLLAHASARDGRGERARPLGLPAGLPRRPPGGARGRLRLERAVGGLPPPRLRRRAHAGRAARAPGHRARRSWRRSPALRAADGGRRSRSCSPAAARAAPTRSGCCPCCCPRCRWTERPNLILGTSVGALNGAYLAATLPDGVDAALVDGRAIWEDIRWGDVLATPSLRDLERLAARRLNFTGLLSLDVPALLDATPLRATLERVIPFERIDEHVAAGTLHRRRGRRHVGADRPQRRLPPRRDAGRAARRQARDRLRARRRSTSSTCAPRRRSRPLFPAVEIEAGRPPAGTSTAAPA